MKKIGLYIALSLTGLSPATTFTATTSTASTSASEPANAVSQQTALAQPASKELPPTMKQASYTRRFCAYLIEFVPIVLIYLIATNKYTVTRVDVNSGEKKIYPTSRKFFISYVIILLFGFLLQIYPKGGGLGKYLLGIKVVDRKGADLDYSRLFLRTFIRYVQVIPWLIYYSICIIIDIRSEGLNNIVLWSSNIIILAWFSLSFIKDRLLHNYVADTYVVLEKSQKPQHPKKNTRQLSLS